LLCAASLLLFAVGGHLRHPYRVTVFLVPVMAVGMMFLPFWYVR
jgi:hypothetical protein